MARTARPTPPTASCADGRQPGQLAWPRTWPTAQPPAWPLHRDGYLIHVKSFTKSQTLSHLFSQDLVSAIILRGDSIYRSNLIRAVNKIDPDFVKTAERAPEGSRIRIGVKKDRPVPLGLPSFSKVNFATSSSGCAALAHVQRPVGFR